MLKQKFWLKLIETNNYGLERIFLQRFLFLSFKTNKSGKNVK